MVLANTTSPNIRELSKKEKILGLGKATWFILIYLALILMNWLPLQLAAGIFVCGVFVSYVAEFFDDAFFVIVLHRFRLYPRGSGSIYYP